MTTHAGRPRAVTAVVDSSRPLAEGLGEFVGASSAIVLALDLGQERAGVEWADAVEGTSRGLLDTLGALVTSKLDRPIVVVIQIDDAPTPVGSAALSAAKGVIGTAALEVSGSGRRINTVILDDSTSWRDIASAVAYLGDDAGAGFTTGATIGLTKRVAKHRPFVERPTRGPVLVTGAAGGLGFAAARALVEAGDDVVLTDLSSEALAAAARELGVLAVPANLTSVGDVDELASHPHLASISSLIVHHGVGGSGAIGQMDPGVRDRSLAINGTAVHNVVSRLLPALCRDEPGSVVVLASQAGLIAERGNASYCAAKFAVVGYVESLATQIASQGVRAHALCPGPIDTTLMRNAFEGMARAANLTFDEYLGTRMGEVPLGRFGEPHHIGSATLFLSRLDATGIILAPTGGVVLT